MGKRAFSAPGKALLVGGYLVLDPQYQSYVVALSSRMHSVVEYKPSDQYKIKVVSAQFDNDTWEYHITTDEQGNLIPQEDNQKNNPFVEKTIFNVLNFLKIKTATQSMISPLKSSQTLDSIQRTKVLLKKMV